MHEVGFDGITIIVADEMQDAVSDEKLELEGEWYAEPARLSLGSIDRNHDLSDEPTGRFGDLQRKGQDVRPPPDAAERAVEPSDLRVRNQGDVDVAPLAARSPQRPFGGPAERTERNGNTVLMVRDRQTH